MLKETILSYKLSQKTFHYQRDLVNFPRCSQGMPCSCRLSFFFFFFWCWIMVVYIYYLLRSRVRNFCLGRPSYGTNIFIKTTPHTHVYIHTLFYYKYALFYLKSYIYTHIQPKKKRSLVFSVKIMLDDDLSSNKI